MYYEQFKTFVRICSINIDVRDTESVEKGIAALFEYVARPLDEEAREEGKEKQWIDIRNFLLFFEIFDEPYVENVGAILLN